MSKGPTRQFHVCFSYRFLFFTVLYFVFCPVLWVRDVDGGNDLWFVISQFSLFPGKRKVRQSGKNQTDYTFLLDPKKGVFVHSEFFIEVYFQSTGAVLKVDFRGPQFDSETMHYFYITASN